MILTKKVFYAVLSISLIAICLTTAALINLGNKKVDGNYDFEKPEIILLYNQSYTAIELTKDTADYNEFWKLFKNSGKISVLQKEKRGISIRENLKQESSSAVIWAETNKTDDRFCVVEFQYTDKKTTTCYQKNNSKSVDYYGLIFCVSNQNKLLDTKIFFRTGQSVETDFSANPFVVQINTIKMYDWIMSKQK